MIIIRKKLNYSFFITFTKIKRDNHVLVAHLVSSMSHSLTHQQIEKLGNALVYLAKSVSEFNKTKILKILFLLEESSIKKYGYPFFGFDFQIWKYGPVLKDVYIDLSEDEPQLLKGYLTKVVDGYKPAVEFKDDEFSENDIDLMDKIIEFARHKTSSDLVKYTHDVNSLWRKSAIAYGILEELESENINSTDKTIDFSLLFEENDFRKARYESALENLHFINHLKSR
jgi:uncharacterized phage-associated protein